MNSEKRVSCRYCGEMIMSGAYKCRFCSSWLIEGGRDAVDKAMWADQEKKKCEDLLKKGNWNESYEYVSNIVNKAPSVQWAQEILANLKGEKIEELVNEGEKYRDSNPDKSKEIALEILIIDDGNMWAKSYLEKSIQKDKEEKKRIYKRNAVKEFSKKRYSEAIALCRQALSEGVGAEWTRKMLVDLGESIKASSGFEGLTSIISFCDSWFAGSNSGEIICFDVVQEKIIESKILKFHKKQIISFAADSDFLFALSLDGFVSKWDKNFNLLSNWKIEGTPISLSLKEERLLIGTLEGCIFSLEGSSLSKIFESSDALSAVSFGKKGVYLVDIFGKLSILDVKKNKDGLHNSKKIKDLSSSVVSFSDSIFSTADGSIYFEKNKWKSVSFENSILSISEMGKNCFVSGHFGLKVIGESDHELSSRSTLLLAFNGKDFLSYKGDNSLELWSALRWVD